MVKKKEKKSPSWSPSASMPHGTHRSSPWSHASQEWQHQIVDSGGWGGVWCLCVGGSFTPISGAATKEQQRNSWWRKLSSILPVLHCSQSFERLQWGFLSVYSLIFVLPNSVTWYDKHNPEQAERGCWWGEKRRRKKEWKKDRKEKAVLDIIY